MTGQHFSDFETEGRRRGVLAEARGRAEGGRAREWSRDGRVIEAREREKILDDKPIDGVLVLRLERFAELLIRAHEAADAQEAHDTQRAARRTEDGRNLARALEDTSELKHD